MVLFSNEKYYLSELIQEKLNSHTSHFQRMESVELEYFPQLGIQDLQLYTCGLYAINIARSYYTDHLNPEGDFKFELSK